MPFHVFFNESKLVSYLESSQRPYPSKNNNLSTLNEQVNISRL